MHLFVVQVTVGTTHGDTQYSVNKQTSKLFNVTPSGDGKYQLILAAHRRYFLEEYKFRFPWSYLKNVILAKYFIIAKNCLHTVSSKSGQKSVGKTCQEMKGFTKVSTNSVHKT